MTVNNFTTVLAWLGHQVAVGLLVMVLIIGSWQGLGSSLTAIAGPAGDVITAADLPNKTQDDVKITKKRRQDQPTEARTVPNSSAVRAKALKKIEQFFGRMPQTEQNQQNAIPIDSTPTNE